jgi:hypothetical protein
MSVVEEIRCDGCGSRIGRASRTKIYWSREPFRKEASDLCTDCRELVVVAISRAPRALAVKRAK